jgi:uridylate kinase
MLTVISLGGSIVAPDKIDVPFLSEFILLIEKLLHEDAARKFIFVVGGGAPARLYQNALRETAVSARLGTDNMDECADWLGIMATRLNAQLVKSLFSKYCPNDVVTDPTADFSWDSRILVAAGWKPGFSSDNDAVLLARRFGSKLLINLSNIEKVYTADPKLDANAKPLDTISWKEFRAMVGNTWTPGKNLPFDPIASANAEENNIKVICAEGRNLKNLEKIISGGDGWIGTTIG